VIGQADWQKTLDAVRTPLGRMLSRKVIVAKYTRTVPGGPDGDYVIVQFETSFEKKQTAIKTVTPHEGSRRKLARVRLLHQVNAGALVAPR
jgi:hypothetical protein